MGESFTSSKPGDTVAKAGVDSARAGAESTKGPAGVEDAKRGDAATTANRAAAPVGTGVRAEAVPGTGVRSATSLNATPIPQRMIQCPKCGADAREVARFCPRCHATLRFECPACKHQQRKGGSCEKCGVNFVKYITAVVAAKKIEADQVHDRIERRTGIIKQVFLLPITGGLSLFKYFFRPSKN
ncbi:MAG: zinc ribbon domain-containing protein [Candidatus Acidiferrales bacterium]